jgi:putative transposase
MGEKFRSGYLFQNRYKSIVCDEEVYFQKLVRYIHLNPLRAGLTSNMEQLNRYP